MSDRSSVMIPYGKHVLDEDDIESVVDVLRHGWLTQGPMIERFEKAIAEYCGAQYAVAVSSLTAGMHISCLAMGLKPKDVLLTSPISFCASSNCALYVGATPDFVDVSSETSLMNPAELEKKCKQYGNKVKAIVPVYFAGLPCDMEAISAIAKKHDIPIMVDAAHALGTEYDSGKKVGSCESSLITGFSFHPVKSITSGEGGVMTTNDESVYRSLLRLRSHGINKAGDSLVYPAESQDNPYYHEMQELGFNYRMTDLQSALGLSQMSKLDEFVAKRRELANYYDDKFSDFKNLDLVHKGLRNKSANHLYVVRVKFDQIGMNRRQLHEKLLEKNICCQLHYLPIPMHPYYQKNLDISKDDYSEAANHYNEALSIPLFPSLTDEEKEHTVAVFKELVG